LIRSLQTTVDVVYGIYAVLVFMVLGISAVALVTLIPRLSIHKRRAIAHHSARAFFATAGIRVAINGVERLPAGPCVVVANHASYLDGVLLKAFLPARFSFVIKKEVSKVPMAGLLLRRIGSEFVDRFNRNAGAADARRLIKAADAGQALAFFPEGTFNAEPGLGKFHTGAFAIAARAGMPIVPIAIHGTRYMLPSGRYLPRPGRLRVDILPPIAVNSAIETGLAAKELRDRSHAAILAMVDEPDLSATDGVAAIVTTRKS
jgi:1-acyl-sn-glycerol-3-phosphate acyltransferase